MIAKRTCYCNQELPYIQLTMMVSIAKTKNKPKADTYQSANWNR